MIQTASIKRNIRYAGLLTNIELIVDASGLVTNTTNSYGQVDGSNVIVQLNSIAPGPTSRDFTVNGSGVTFDPTTKSIAFNGSGRLRSTGAASLFNFMSFHASGYSSIKWTAFIVCKLGTTIKPAAATYGIIGNNGTSSVNKGMSLNYTNTTTNEDTLTTSVTRGTGSSFLGRLLVPGSGPSNQYCVITVQFDGSLAPSPMRLYVNDQALLNIEQLDNSTSPVTTPTFAMELGGCGNAVVPMIGNIKEVIITSAAPTYLTTVAVIRQLMNKHNIVRTRTSDYLNKSLVPEIFFSDLGGGTSDYFLCAVISQDPTNPQRVFAGYSVGSQHTYESGKHLDGRVSLVKAAPFTNTFGAAATIYNPAGNDAVQDVGGGFDNNGVMHLFCDVINGSTAGTMVAARHIYSSDLSNWTNTDITASLHSDGLAGWRMYGNMIHVGGTWLKPYYKFTDNGDVTNSANYVLRSTDGINWTSITVRASAATYINEASIFWLGGNDFGYLARNESTGEWSLSISLDDGLTWDAMTDVTFGETVVSANPPMVKTFTLNGQLVVVAYITNRNNDTAFAIYGLPANILISRGSGWDTGTKIMWWKTNLAPNHYHYGDVAHLDGTLKAVGLYCYDLFPGSGTGLANELHYTVMPTWHVALIESELGI